ncbi:putative bifunctional diguanylate cyclase/phosphodiesterase [Kineococcus sp. SYSU DK005]|uniref:putative bifunctional diguanylate cyclase/phosphodiesterase n=1 Tax=Kineococcus sp. SYSU DK005 TaxID=3383126 RepID=UPI003D7E8849
MSAAARERVLAALLAAGALTATALSLVPGAAAAASAVQAALWVAVVAALAARAARGTGRAPWAWFAAGLALLVAGRLALLASAGSALVGPDVLDRHGWLLLATLTGYAPFWAGQVALLKQRVRGARDSWLDGLLAATLLAAVCAAVFLEPLQRTTGMGPAAVSAAVGRPALDVLLLVLALATWALAGPRSDRRLPLAAAAFALITLADLTDLARLAGLAGAVAAVSPVSAAVDLGRLAAAALLLLASRRPAGAGEPRTSPAGAVMLAPVLVLVGSLALLAVDQRHPLPGAAVALALAAAGGVTVKVVVAFLDQVRLADSHRQAVTDDLTGLANRRALFHRLEQAGAGGHGVGLLLVDLDRFKDVNDTLGHHRGDELLRAVAARLGARLPGGVLLTRLGGDEFALVVPGAGTAGARALADGLIAALAEPFEVGGTAVHVGASIGVTASAAAPAALDDALELLRQADTAMYVAKRAGGGVAVYDEEVDRGARERLQLLEELRTALAEGQLVAHYQPQVDVRSGRVVGMEALVRWQHPERGTLPPAAFLDLAEERGLTGRLTEVVLRRAVAEAVRWREAGHPLRIAVNVATSCLLNRSLPVLVREVLHEAGLEPSALVVEITETTLMQDPERSRRTVAELLAVGAAVSIDDYGTGYSSLAYLRDLPAVELKLDRTFTARVTADERSAAIVAGTADLAHSLGMRLLAEGVEDAATLHRLAQLGVDETQGYHHCRPVPAEEVLGWLERFEARPAAALLAPRP